VEHPVPVLSLKPLSHLPLSLIFRSASPPSPFLLTSFPLLLPSIVPLTFDAFLLQSGAAVHGKLEMHDEVEEEEVCACIF
jgi:hypothetical protein